jgi:hypothetical protein
VLQPPPILPSNLDALLRLISNGLVYQLPVRGDPRCAVTGDHDMRLWITGTYAGRELNLRKCPGCGGVEVRDRSWGGQVGGARLAQRRIDALLGWYTTSRPGGRIYG